MGSDVAAQGFFSLLRWRADVTRDEARNLAIILQSEDGGLLRMVHAPVSSVSPRLHEQGLIDELLAGLEDRLGSQTGEPFLWHLHKSLSGPIVLTEPQPVAIREEEETIRALYRAYVAPRRAPSRAPSQWVVLDRVVSTLRNQGHVVRRGEYVQDFIFHAVLGEGSESLPLEVLSYGASRKDWTPVERDAGHYLFALQELRSPGLAIVYPPPEAESAGPAHSSYERVCRWFESRDVPVRAPDELEGAQLELVR
jgi:hypothetical protein